MTANENAINWFEIPVSDMARAKAFYSRILGIEMPETEMIGKKMAFFPYDNGSGNVSGALTLSGDHKPSADGARVYLNCNPDLSPTLARIEAEGNKVTLPKTAIPGAGYMAFFIDTEGNRIGLHSMK
jgi:predicted enzyme related to lactoylglutathione lyase